MKQMKNNKKNYKIDKGNEGITLIALIITIIIMLILVAVTINLAVNGGLFGYAGNAAKETEIEKEKEEITAEGSLEVNGKKYDTPEDYIDGYESTGEKFSQIYTSTQEYVDKNGDTAIIPKGYAVGISDGINTIEDGLVIKDHLRNEFVWIPIPEKDFKVATTSDRYTSYVNETEYEEPKELTRTDSNTSSAPGGPYKLDSQEELDFYYGTGYFTYPSDVSDENNVTDFSYGVHYKEMAESVNEYGGFYIGRYETTYEITADNNRKICCKPNQRVLTEGRKIKEGTNPNNNQPYVYRWWGMYAAQRHAEVAENGVTVQTNMMWGQQWNRMMDYFIAHNIMWYKIYDGSYVGPGVKMYSGQATYTNPEDETDVIKDKVYNIYDIQSNTHDMLAEALFDFRRVGRGGNYLESATDALPNWKRYGYPYYTYATSGTRLTLYIK